MESLSLFLLYLSFGCYHVAAICPGRCYISCNKILRFTREETYLLKLTMLLKYVTSQKLFYRTKTHGGGGIKFWIFLKHFFRNELQHSHSWESLDTYLVLFKNHLEKGEICGKQVRPEDREGSVRILPVRSGFLKQALAVAGRVADPGGEDPNMDPKVKKKNRIRSSKRSESGISTK